MEEIQETPENENVNPEVAKKQLGDKIFGAHNNPTKDNDYNDKLIFK